MGGVEVEEEDQSSSNSVGGVDEIVSEQNPINQVEEQGDDATTSNPMERTENVEALATEARTRVALNATTIEVEGVGAIMTEDDAEILTIESSPKWGGTLIEEENWMEEARKSTEKGNVPSTSAIDQESTCMNHDL